MLRTIFKKIMNIPFLRYYRYYPSGTVVGNFISGVVGYVQYLFYYFYFVPIYDGNTVELTRILNNIMAFMDQNGIILTIYRINAKLRAILTKIKNIPFSRYVPSFDECFCCFIAAMIYFTYHYVNFGCRLFPITDGNALEITCSVSNVIACMLTIKPTIILTAYRINDSTFFSHCCGLRDSRF